MPTRLEYTSSVEPHVVQSWSQNTTDKSLGQWVNIERLRARTLRRVVQPHKGMSQAILEYPYGRLIDGGRDVGLVLPLGEIGSAIFEGGLLNRFFRIQILDDLTGQFTYWVGVAVSVSDRDQKKPLLPDTVNDTVDRYGTQEITLLGPEYLLSRKQLLKSTIWTGAGVTADSYEVNRALPFNMSPDAKISQSNPDEGANRHEEENGFTDELDDALPWTAKSIVQYLLTWYAPARNDSGQQPYTSPVFSWKHSGLDSLSWHKPMLETHGKTLLQILNEVVNPRRFLQYRIDYEFDPQKPDVAFGSFRLAFSTASSKQIDLPDQAETKIPANTDTVELSMSGNPSARLSLSEDAQQQYEQVIFTGARKGIVCTLTLAERDEIGAEPEPPADFLERRLLVRDWSEADEEDYINGLAVPPTDELVDIEEKNAIYRETLLSHVFTKFKVPIDVPAERFGIPNAGDLKLYVPGLRFLRFLPLKERWDYSLNSPAPLEGASAQPENRAMFLTVLLPLAVPQRTTYATGEQLGQVMRSERFLEEPSSVQVRPAEDNFGLHIQPRTEPHWQKNTVATVNSAVIPAFNFVSDYWVTVYFQYDDWAAGKWPEDAQVDESSTNTLTVRLGDVAFLDHLAKDTIVDVDPAAELGVKRAPGTIAIRDDTEILKSLARMAWQWYGTNRQAFTLSWAQLVRDLHPGQVVTSIDGVDTDVVITEVSWNFDNTQTDIATSYAEPDFTALAREAVLAS